MSSLGWIDLVSCEGSVGVDGEPDSPTSCISLGLGPYSTSIKKAEKEIKEMAKKINDLCVLFYVAKANHSIKRMFAWSVAENEAAPRDPDKLVERTMDPIAYRFRFGEFEKSVCIMFKGKKKWW
ncbi:hypothetical protein NE237_028707 [Protea cynaroides]|uniref:Uncharacterized protein n=1 Tax=Protea cynaroides TaxID=273540 RepID=A0A9Q0JVE2_9MAGN|nr:hypothetical protein NE237_028707 [Protea cynaroides]